MIVSHSHKFIFFHNPKCAGTSFRDTLKPWHDDPFTFWGIFHAPYFKNYIDHTHLRLWELHAQFPSLFACARRYNSIIFVRSPYARFLSALSEHMKKFQPEIDLPAMDDAKRRAVMEEFVAKVLNISRITTDWRFIHFSPQIWYLQLGGTQIPRHVIPMGGGDPAAFARAGFAALGLPDQAMPWHNRSPVDLSAVLESPAIRTFVESFYAEDFAFLAADPALAHLAVPPA